ncbi:MAG: helix-turn-helix transcriptional regulator [Crocinitomicaceae bacterium]|nr:helix-turn-helix transcriptional regulator [Crocinitomicaceae bacterium]MBK8925206.1 helix-turn-helix transcriptional regulator [Crocinitomicaceae bacterium]
MKKLTKKINVTVEKTKTGYSAYAEDMAVFSTAKDITSLYDNLIDALNLAYEESGYFVDAKNIKLNLDLQQFFQYYRVLNANFLAKRIGMNPTLLSQYVQGRKNPSAKQTDKIIQGIHTIGKELSDIRFV